MYTTTLYSNSKAFAYRQFSSKKEAEDFGKKMVSKADVTYKVTLS